jgi:hypothetical protein
MQRDSDKATDEKWVPASGGPEPTPEEERAAEGAARIVDLEKVAEHEREMLALGANVRGEGQIEPDQPKDITNERSTP